MDFQEPSFFSRQIRQAKRFFRNPQTDPSVRVLAGGREICAPGYRIEREGFPYVAVEFVSAGQGRLSLSGTDYILNPGTLFIYGPHHPHSISLTPGEPLEKYFLNLHPTEELFRLDLYGKVFHTSHPQSILLSFEELIDFGLDPSPGAEQVCCSLFDLILNKARYSALIHGDYQSPSYRNFRRCKRVIESNHLRLRSSEKAARMCGISEAHLCRLFSRYDKQSPYRYLMGLRMNHAADLILTSGLSVKEAANRLGYQDQGHFSRSFKRILGIPPSELKQ